jgi:hypothetical protein
MSEQEFLKDFVIELKRFIEKLEHDRDYWKDLARHASRHYCDKEICNLCLDLRSAFPTGRLPL